MRKRNNEVKAYDNIIMISHELQKMVSEKMDKRKEMKIVDGENNTIGLLTLKNGGRETREVALKKKQVSEINSCAYNVHDFLLMIKHICL